MLKVPAHSTGHMPPEMHIVFPVLFTTALPGDPGCKLMNTKTEKEDIGSCLFVWLVIYLSGSFQQSHTGTACCSHHDCELMVEAPNDACNLLIGINHFYDEVYPGLLVCAPTHTNNSYHVLEHLPSRNATFP